MFSMVPYLIASLHQEPETPVFIFILELWDYVWYLHDEYKNDDDEKSSCQNNLSPLCIISSPHHSLLLHKILPLMIQLPLLLPCLPLLIVQYRKAVHRPPPITAGTLYTCSIGMAQARHQD